MLPVTAAWLGWVSAMSTGGLFAIVGAVLWLFIRGDRPMQEHGHQ